jgi:hypothetical protein
MRIAMAICFALVAGMASAQDEKKAGLWIETPPQIGDTLYLGKGSAPDGTFVYVTNMGFPGLPKIANRVAIVKGVKVKKGTTLLIIDAMEFANLKVYMDNAFEAGEIRRDRYTQAKVSQ